MQSQGLTSICLWRRTTKTNHNYVSRQGGTMMLLMIAW